jgi:RNA polymerase sigma factor (sigma-70 family)
VATSPGELTLLIRRAMEHPEDGQAREELYRQVELDLFRAAKRLRARLSPGHTFQTADLVQEAMVEMLAHDGKEWADSRHYMRTAIQVMRHKIVDHARRRRPEKLKSKQLSGLEANEADSPLAELARAERQLALYAAVDKLLKEDPETGEVFVVRYFGGCRMAFDQSVQELVAQPTAGEKLTLEETAKILERPVSTVGFRWKKAQMFLSRELKDFRTDGK